MSEDHNQPHTSDLYYGVTEAVDKLLELLHEHERFVVFAADHGCEEPDADDEPPCVDIPLGVMRQARSALTRARASTQRVRILEDALTAVAHTAESCPDDEEQLEDVLRDHIPALARRALSAPIQAPLEQADEKTLQRVEELEGALREVLIHEDECFQYSHELTHRVWVDIPDLARSAVRGFDTEPEPYFLEEVAEGELPF